jgi:Cytotoxic translational repressor of toxin-antitoxin stability system
LKSTPPPLAGVADDGHGSEPVVSSPTVANQRYQIKYEETALDDLRELPKKHADQIIRKIQRLEQGLHGNIKRLQSADVAFRLRMGDYRILFDVVGDKILIQRIGNRKDIYE